MNCFEIKREKFKDRVEGRKEKDGEKQKKRGETRNKNEK
jgi:hypothetical protein